jgi:hypothetical protein
MISTSEEGITGGEAETAGMAASHSPMASMMKKPIWISNLKSIFSLYR